MMHHHRVERVASANEVAQLVEVLAVARDEKGHDDNARDTGRSQCGHFTLEWAFARAWSHQERHANGTGEPHGGSKVEHLLVPAGSASVRDQEHAVGGSLCDSVERRHGEDKRGEQPED